MILLVLDKSSGWSAWGWRQSSSSSCSRSEPYQSSVRMRLIVRWLGRGKSLSKLELVMSSEGPSETNDDRICKIARSFKRKLSSLLHLSPSPALARAPTPSSIDDNPQANTRWVTKSFFSDISFIETISSTLPLTNVPVVSVVDHATTTEASSPDPPTASVNNLPCCADDYRC